MDEMEFARRVRACTDRLFRVCYALLPERADREDAIQEALIKAWRRIGTLKDEAAFEGWLTRIAINECKSALRRRRRRPEAEMCESIPARDSIPDLALHDALMGLELKLRMPVVLHYVEGFTLQQTAKLLRLPPGTAKRRLKQARLLLKAQLKEE